MHLLLCLTGYLLHLFIQLHYVSFFQQNGLLVLHLLFLLQLAYVHELGGNVLQFYLVFFYCLVFLLDLLDLVDDDLLLLDDDLLLLSDDLLLLTDELLLLLYLHVILLDPDILLLLLHTLHFHLLLPDDPILLLDSVF